MSVPTEPESTALETVSSADLTKLKEVIMAHTTLVEARVHAENRIANVERALKGLIGSTGLTILVIICGAYWMGNKFASLDSSVQTSSERVSTLYKVVWEDEDSLATRTRLMKEKLDPMDKKLDKIDASLTNLMILRYGTGVKAVGTPEPVPDPNPNPER